MARWSSANACRHCARHFDPFGRCRRKDCPGYRDLWSQDWRVNFLTNLRELEHVALITITAPGLDYGLAWDPDHCTHDPGEKCSGKKGCRVVPAVAEVWNENAESNLAKLHRSAVGRLRRRLGNGPVVAAKCWERQERGVWHAHIAVPFAPGRERQRAEYYSASLKEKAGAYGFGFVDLRKPPAGASAIAAASYLAKYVGKAVSESVTGVKRPAYVGRFLTMRTGVTMRSLRWRRYLALRLHLPKIALPDLAPLIALFTAFPSLELVPEPARGP